ncbi:MAG TPA: response regulator [Ramlibacter sp.]|uniref:response regulator n=1 Tax=Ramlibacter sp. TaxID=1917967 RepID=UPI002CE0907B|nr:response regulator [Ramlibacter sp.]HVZ42307.1 response regulator [Ramlibacter sp.]
MTFPLFHRPGTIVFLDDDPDYLEMLALVLPRHWHVKLFLRPAECIHYLQQEPPFWEADAWNQQQIVEQWRSGKPLIPQVLAYWSKYTERFALTRVCVVDFSMPGMDGLQVLAELGDWPGSRVLLTGQADEQVAVRAFNRGLIDQFIPKQTPDISKRLVESVEHLLATPHSRHAQTWRATLTPDQGALLRQPSVARDLAAFAAKRWTEHVLIGEPFGVLGMDAAGQVSWLQLETPAGLGALAEVADVEGMPPATLEGIRQGRVLADIELRQTLGAKTAPEVLPAFRLGDEGQLLGAAFAVPTEHAPDVGNSYAGWLARQDRRRVED